MYKLNKLKKNIEKLQNKKYWENISDVKLKKLKKSFKIKFIGKIFQMKKLSEEFIEKFQDKVHWENISRYQKLSEEFIEKFQDKVHWKNISQ